MYTGRISKDKNLDFLIKVYNRVNENNSDINLIFVGDGPYYQELSKSVNDKPGIVFTGRLKREKLSNIYASADILLFSSTTDTFGMTVLEAQSCGLPALVSDIGGPQEIVNEGQSGFILSVDTIDPWVKTIEFLLPEIRNNSTYYQKLKQQSRATVLNSYKWKEVLHDLILGGQEMSNSEKENYSMAVR